MSPEAYAAFATKFPAAVHFFETDDRFQVQKKQGTFVSVGIRKDAPAVLAEIKSKFAAAMPELTPTFYDPHAMMAKILSQMFDSGELTYTENLSGGFLSRSAGPCSFCDNQHWSFPLGCCPYDKPKAKQYPVGFLETVAQAMVDSANN